MEKYRKAKSGLLFLILDWRGDFLCKNKYSKHNSFQLKSGLRTSADTFWEGTWHS